MRRKIKLLITICSLGFSLALMTFGVFAATSHTLTITSSVSYSIGDNIQCQIDAKTFVQTAEPTWSSENPVSIHKATASIAQELDDPTYDALTGVNGKMTIEKQAIYWLFKVTNTAPETANSFTVSVKNELDDLILSLPAELNSYNLVMTQGTSDSAKIEGTFNGTTASIAPQGVVYIMIKVSPKDLNKNIIGKDFNFKLHLKHA